MVLNCGHPTKKDICEVERIQRSFTKYISGMQNLSYHQRLNALRLYSLQRRRDRYIVIYMWKILENLVPNLIPKVQIYLDLNLDLDLDMYAVSILQDHYNSGQSVISTVYCHDTSQQT